MAVEWPASTLKTMTRSSKKSYRSSARIIVLLTCAQIVCSFHARLPMRSMSSALRSRTPGDFEGSIGEDGIDPEAQALTREFYQQVRLREIQRKRRIARMNDGPRLSGKEARARNRESLGNRDGNTSSSAFTFAGNRPSSAGFFSGEGDSVYSLPSVGLQGASSASPSTPHTVDKEFHLLGIADQSLVVQGIVAAFVISAYVAVGVAGDMAGIEAPKSSDWMWSSMPSVVELKTAHSTADTSVMS